MKALVYGRHLHPDGFAAVNKPATPEAIPYAVTALALGFRKLGWEGQLRGSRFFTPSDVERCDVACVLGLHGTKHIKAAYEQAGIPVLLLDLGYFRRDLGFFQLGIGGLNDIFPGACKGDRAEAIGLVARDSAATPGGPIVLMGQLANDQAHGISDMGAWATKTADTLTRLHKLPVVWRPHPQQVFQIPGVSRFDDPREVPIARSLQGASAVATHNSTAALEAMVAGIPVLCDAGASYAAFSGRLETPGIPAHDKERVQAFLNRVAYSQWLPTELEAGAFGPSLIPRIERAAEFAGAFDELRIEAERERLAAEVARLESRVRDQDAEIQRLVRDLEMSRANARGRKGRG